MSAMRSRNDATALSRFLAKSRAEKCAAIRATLGHLLKIGHQPGPENTLAHHRWAAPAAIRAGRPCYLALRPDSDRLGEQYPELGALSEAWVRHNEAPNATDLPRLYGFILNIRQVLAEGVAGDFAELGVYRGNSAAVLAHYARAAGRELYLFDTFEGFDPRDLVRSDGWRQKEFSDTSLDAVRDFVGEEGTRYFRGRFPDSVPSNLTETRFGVVHLDCDLYAPIKAGMEFFFPRLSAGGLMIVHDYSGLYWDGVKRAVDEFLRARPERPVLLPDRSGTAIIRREAP